MEKSIGLLLFYGLMLLSVSLIRRYTLSPARGTFSRIKAAFSLNDNPLSGSESAIRGQYSGLLGIVSGFLLAILSQLNVEIEESWGLIYFILVFFSSIFWFVPLLRWRFCQNDETYSVINQSLNFLVSSYGYKFKQFYSLSDTYCFVGKLCKLYVYFTVDHWEVSMGPTLKIQRKYKFTKQELTPLEILWILQGKGIYLNIEDNRHNLQEALGFYAILLQENCVNYLQGDFSSWREVRKTLVRSNIIRF